MIVYISGRMRGVPCYGFGNFEDAEQTLRAQMNCEVINPHKEDLKQGFDVRKLPPDHNWHDYPPNFDKEACYQRCIEAVKRCDAIYMLNGWEQSTGAKAERALAEWMGKEIMYETDTGKITCERCGEPMFPDDTTHYHYCAPVVDLSKEDIFRGGLGAGTMAENDAEYWRKRVDDFVAAMEKVEDERDGLGANPENKGVAGGKPSNTENPKDSIGSGKLPIHLWPTTATMMGCIGFLNGMMKYGRANFRAVGVRSSIYYDACRRHIDAWFEGEDIDPDDNVPHLAAALCCLAIIVDAQAANKLNDDRNFPGGYRKLRNQLSPLVAMLKEKHAEKNPKHYTIGDING